MSHLTHADRAHSPAVRLPFTFLAAAAAVGLMALTVWLRLRHLGYTEFGLDQALTLDKSLEWVHGGPLPLAAMKTTIGVYNFPLVEYIWALPLLIRPDIMGVLWLIALANLAGVFVAGLATARVFGWRVAWWATLLFAVNPWAVYYGRLIWLPSLIPFFIALFYVCFLSFFTREPRPVYLIVGAVCLAAATQQHPASLVMCLVVALVGLCFPRRFRLWPTVLAASLFLLTFTPYLVFEIKNNFVNWRALQATAAQPPVTDLASLRIVLDLLNSEGIVLTLGSAATRWRLLDLLWLKADAMVAVWLGLAVVAGLITVGVELRRARTTEKLPPHVVGQLGLLIWLVAPILAFLRHTHDLQHYYFLYIYPVPFVLTALFADRLYLWLTRRADRLSLRAGRRIARGAAAAAFLPLAIIAFQQARLDVIGQDLLAAGVSGHQRVVDVRRAIDAARQLMAERPDCQLVVMSEGAKYESSRFALLREFVGKSRVRFVEAGVGYLLPSPCAVYFSVTDNPEARTWLAVIARPLAAYTIHTPQETWTFHDLTTSDRSAAAGGAVPDSSLGQWANGLQLARLEVRGDLRSAGTLTLASTWRAASADPSAEVHFGNYLLDRNRALVAQVDGPGVDSTEWRAGDVFETVFRLPLPSELSPGAYALAVAVYYYPEIERVPLAGGNGDLLVLEELNVP